MFWKVTNERYPCTFIESDHIEAITIIDDAMIGVHLTNAKEYRAHILNLIDLNDIINIEFWKLTNEKYPNTFIRIKSISTITFHNDGRSIKVHLLSGKEFIAYIECLEGLNNKLNINLKFS